MNQVSTRLKKFFRKLGPGVITGASDDDPSGITTYSVAGAQFGYQTLWTVLLTFPLMAAIQEMCARIGMITEHGLVGTMRRHYPRFLLWSVAVLMLFASTVNIGSDIGGMAAAAQLLVPSVPSYLLAILFTVLILFLVVYFPYRIIAKTLKWLTLALFAYIAASFLTDQSWAEAIRSTLVPQFQWSKDYLLVLLGVLGTTISPYLFFWQASEEAEEEHQKPNHTIVTKHELKAMKEDVAVGMLFSNIVMFFIIATTASTLFRAGIHEISSAQQAAQALEPFAGRYSTLLFATGLFGTGLLAIPVLAGAAAYAMAEAFGWQEGLDRPFRKARRFYLVIIFSGLLGLAMNFLGLNPFLMLFWTAILYGLLSPLLIAFVLHIPNNRTIMGDHTNRLLSNVLGLVALFVMTATAVALLVTVG